MIDILTIGESLGLLVPERTGRLAHVREMRLGFGGAESNVAIGASRLGASSAWCGRVGADGLGELIVREIRAEGVAVHAEIDERAATAMMLKERPTAGTSRLTYYRAGHAGSRLVPTDIPDSLVESATLLHLTGISAGLGEGPMATAHAAIDRARTAGAVVSFDVNHRSALWGEGRDGRDAGDAYRSLAARADIVFASEDEAELTTGATDVDAQIDTLLEWGASCAVIKRGEQGAVAGTASHRVSSAAIAVDVVDTVGAGDAFVAGWLVETVRGASLTERLDIAIACGAFACTAEGDWEAAPSRGDLERLRIPPADPVSR